MNVQVAKFHIVWSGLKAIDVLFSSVSNQSKGPLWNMFIVNAQAIGPVRRK